MSGFSQIESVVPGMGEARKCALCDPSMDPKATAVFGVAFCGDRNNAATVKFLAVRFGIVSTITLHDAGLSTGAVRLATDGRNRLNEGYQLFHIMAVGTREYHGKRNTSGLGNKVVFAARFSLICGVQSCREKNCFFSNFFVDI